MNSRTETQRHQLMLRSTMFGVVIGTVISLAMLSHGSEGVLATFVQMLVATAASYLIIAKIGPRVIANDQ